MYNFPFLMCVTDAIGTSPKFFEPCAGRRVASGSSYRRHFGGICRLHVAESAADILVPLRPVQEQWTMGDAGFFSTVPVTLLAAGSGLGDRGGRMSEACWFSIVRLQTVRGGSTL